MLQEQSNPDESRWFPGAKVNIALSALQCRKALPGKAAVIWADEDSPQQLHHVTLPALRSRALHVAENIRMLFRQGNSLNILDLLRNCFSDKEVRMGQLDLPAE